MEHGLKEGIYMIKSVVDGQVLTAISEGCPRPVKTAAWEELDGQKWKVKVRDIDGKKVQIIRNETIKNNEVSKKFVGECAEGEEKEMGPVDWKFTPAEGHVDTFTLHNGEAFLTNAGKDTRVSFGEAIEGEEGKDAQLWTFEFLSEIVKE